MILLFMIVSISAIDIESSKILPNINPSQMLLRPFKQVSI